MTTSWNVSLGRGNSILCLKSLQSHMPQEHGVDDKLRSTTILKIKDNQAFMVTFRFYSYYLSICVTFVIFVSSCLHIPFCLWIQEKRKQHQYQNAREVGGKKEKIVG